MLARIECRCEREINCLAHSTLNISCSFHRMWASPLSHIFTIHHRCVHRRNVYITFSLVCVRACVRVSLAPPYFWGKNQFIKYVPFAPCHESQSTHLFLRERGWGRNTWPVSKKTNERTNGWGRECITQQLDQFTTILLIVRSRNGKCHTVPKYFYLFEYLYIFMILDKFYKIIRDTWI